MKKKSGKNAGFADHLFRMDMPSGSLEDMGGKGFNLWRMKELGLSVPKACVLSSRLCQEYWKDKASAEEMLRKGFLSGIQSDLAEDGALPLVSVRSGAKISMPGMMDTILNVGLTKSSLPHWEKKLGTKAARDSRRRLLQMFGEVVFGIDASEFEEQLEKAKKKRGVAADGDLDATELLALCGAFEKIIAKKGHAMPEAPEEQIAQAILAVWGSWNSERAIEYRKMEKIPDDMGTAVVIQKMVFGNLNAESCSGVLFSRDPSTGRRKVVGEFLANAQGEDVVAGSRTPNDLQSMEQWNKKAYEELRGAAQMLESAERDMQDVEFTIEDGKVWFLQTRRAKRSAMAAVRCALDMADEGLISKEEALERIDLAQYQALCAPMIAPGFNDAPDATGLAASVGIVTATACFSSEEAQDNPGCILVTRETTPDDLPGMRAAAGILTAQGGVTSHAAVVARGMDKVCVVGASPIAFSKQPNGKVVSARIGEREVKAGDLITLDGASGRVWVGGGVPVVQGGELKELIALHDLAAESAGVFRIATNGMDLRSDQKMIYATYALDASAPDEIREEIALSLPYLNGIIDLAPLSEFAPKEDQEVLDLIGGSSDEDVFEIKARAVLDYEGENKEQIGVHLGARGEEWAGRFERMGFRVYKKGGVKDLERQDSFCVCETPEQTMAALAAARKGTLKAIAAVGAAPKELLLGSESPEAKAFLAMSSPQILSSVLKRKPK